MEFIAATETGKDIAHYWLLVQQLDVPKPILPVVVDFFKRGDL